VVGPIAKIIMKQLIHHNIRVKFIDPSNIVIIALHYDVADINISRQCGREIGEWLAKGPGYQIHSETVSMIWDNGKKYNLTNVQREQAHTAKIRQQQQDGA
jgi:hypothetical protein